MSAQTWARSCRRETRRGVGRSALGAAAALLTVLAGTALGVQPATEAQTAPQGPSDALAATRDPADKVAFPVGRIEIRYQTPVEGLPTPERLLRGTVTLTPTPEGFTGGRRGAEVVRVPLSEFTDENPRLLFPTGLNAVLDEVYRALAEEGYFGVLVRPEETDWAGVNPGEELQDKRGGSTTLRLVVLVAKVAEVRTVGSGRGVEGEQRVNLPLHERVRERSPLREGDLLTRSRLDDYVFRLNRSPARRVDVAVAPTGPAGEATVDYLVTKVKPWRLYGQVSNTGTETTNEWRQRVGFNHYDLTGRDDVLRLDFSTAAFDEANAFSASYELPILGDRLRVRPFMAWSEFDASEVGQALKDFTGENWSAGVEVIGTVYQSGPLFVDLVGGLRYEDVEVTDGTAGVTGNGDFLFPYIGARLERITEPASTFVQVILETNVLDNSEEELLRLGRNRPDERWVALKWDAEQSFFLEPLLNARAWRGEVGDGGGRTLAHEVAFSLRGQTTFGSRVIPSFQGVAGGFYSVRGYPESLAAGDDTTVVTAEYRFHLPRALTPGAKGTLFGRDFRWRPEEPYGRADWDLILRGFIDAGWTRAAEKFVFEPGQTLIGVGVGAELQVRSNITVRVDWGVAARDVDLTGDGSNDVDSGDSRVHFSATLVY